MRKAVVTGGAGFVGSHLVDLLVDRDWQVLVIDDLSSGSLENIADAKRRGDVAVHITDVCAPELAGSFAKFSPEVVFHLAAQSKVRPSVEDPVEDARINVLGTVNVLESARTCGARKVVFASSGGAIYGDGATLPARETATKRPGSPYGISKKVAEDWFRWYRSEYDLDYVLIAPANIYGPRQDPGLEGGVVAIFSLAMLEGRTPTIFGNGTQTRDFVYVEDIVDAFHRAADAGEGVLCNIGSGSEISVNDLYAEIGRQTGFTMPANYDPPKPGDIDRSVVDASRAARVLGWEPFTPLADGLRRTVEWYRAR